MGQKTEPHLVYDIFADFLIFRLEAREYTIGLFRLMLFICPLQRTANPGMAVWLQPKRKYRSNFFVAIGRGPTLYPSTTRVGPYIRLTLADTESARISPLSG